MTNVTQNNLQESAKTDSPELSIDREEFLRVNFSHFS